MYTLVNSRPTQGREGEPTHGRMARLMRVNGGLEIDMEMENANILTEAVTKGNTLTVSETGWARLPSRAAIPSKGSGNWTEWKGVLHAYSL